MGARQLRGFEAPRGRTPRFVWTCSNDTLQPRRAATHRCELLALLGDSYRYLRELCHIRGLWPASNPPSSKRRIQTSSSASSCRRTHPPLEHSSCTGGACAVVKRKCATCIVGVISCSRRDALATSCPSHSLSISPTRQGSTISGILPFLCPGISTLSTPCSPAPPPSSSRSRHMTHRRAISREEMVIFANHRCAGDAHAKNDTSPSDNPASRTQLIPPPCSSARRTAKRATCAALAAAANAAPFRLLPNSSTAGVTEGNVKAVGGNVESRRASTDHGLRSVVRMQVREPALILCVHRVVVSQSVSFPLNTRFLAPSLHTHSLLCM